MLRAIEIICRLDLFNIRLSNRELFYGSPKQQPSDRNNSTFFFHMIGKMEEDVESFRHMRVHFCPCKKKSYLWFYQTNDAIDKKIIFNCAYLFTFRP